MRFLRIALAVAFLGALIIIGPLPRATADTCPHTFATYRYTDSDMRLTFVVRLCEPAEQILVQVEQTREEIGGTSFGTSMEGFVPCVDRVCRTTVGFVHELELARYRASIVWGGGVAVDELGWIYCRTTSTTSECGPRP